MYKRCLILIGLIAFLSSFSGCGKTMLERNWGRSFESAKQNQILDPDAGKNLDPVIGLDGQAAEANMEMYRKDFKKEQPQNVYTINPKDIGDAGQN